jgi:multidrug efflux pump subunit AcrA (membrane-fusion protein)
MKYFKIIFLFALLLLTSCSTGADTSPAPTVPAEETSLETDISPANIRANGILLPIRQMELSFGTGGFIQNVEVEVGEFVSLGQVLISLDSTEADLALQQAEADLAAAQANYDLVTAGKPTEQEAAIAAANLELIAAQQSLAAVYADADLAAAQALQAVVDAQKAVADNKRALDNMGAAANQATIDAAYANMILAKDKLDKAEDDYEPWRNKPENNTTRAALLSKVAEAQLIFDATVRKYNGYIGSTNDLDLAQAEADLALAQAQLANAEENYRNLKDGPDPDEIALAEARVADAQARLTLAESGGPTTEQLSLAKAQVDSARASLEIAQSQFDRMVIIAPYDGIISVVDANPGEWARPDEMMVEVLDTARWRIETKNVGELQIGQVALGQVVQIKVNAFKNKTVVGTVVAISPVAVVQQGDTTYTLTIEIEPTPLNLWPGMTAQVEILVD